MANVRASGGDPEPYELVDEGGLPGREDRGGSLGTGVTGSLGTGVAGSLGSLGAGTVGSPGSGAAGSLGSPGLRALRGRSRKSEGKSVSRFALKMTRHQ